jgi:predicted DNA-binding protein with PD1-like motif
MEGNIIFAAEATITEIPGDALNRVFDEATGLKLWG